MIDGERERRVRHVGEAATDIDVTRRHRKGEDIGGIRLRVRIPCRRLAVERRAARRQPRNLVSRPDLTATIGEITDRTAVASAKDEAAKGKLGVAVRPLSPEEMKSVDVPNGVVVEDVAGAAARAGVRQGDVIVAVNNVPIKSPEQLRELVSKAGKSVALLVQREDTRIFIPVTVG